MIITDQSNNMGNVKKMWSIYPGSVLVNLCLYSIFVTIKIFDWSRVNSWKKKEFCFSKKTEMLNFWTWNFDKDEQN